MNKSVYGISFEIEVSGVPADQASDLAQFLVHQMMKAAHFDADLQDGVNLTGGTLRWRFFSHGWETCGVLQPTEDEAPDIDLDVWGEALGGDA